MTAPKIENVCMDLDDTLMPTNYRYHLAIWRCGLIVANALGSRSPRPEEVISVQRQIDERLFAEYRFRVDRFPTSWVETYATLAVRAGLEADARTTRRLYNTAQQFKFGPFKAFKGTKAALRRLRQARRKLYLVTAGESFLQLRKVDQSGISRYIEPENVHVTLGDKAKVLAKIAGDHPERCLMVGDSKRNDIKAAQSLGILTVWIPSETKSREDPNIKPDFEIAHISELPDLIAAIESGKRRPSR